MPSTRDSFQSEARYTGHGSFGTRIASGDDNDHYGPFSTSTQMSPTSDENRGKRRPRDDEHVDDQDSQAEDGDASPGSLKKRRIRKGLEKKFECPHEGCGKSYSRAEHLYRHQLNRKLCLSFVGNGITNKMETIQNSYTTATSPTASGPS